MNAGAYGGEIAHILQSCKVLTPEGELKTLTAEELAFGYRHSKLQETGDVVISAKFALAPGNYEQIDQEMARLTHLSSSNPSNIRLVVRSSNGQSVTLQDS